MNIIQVIIEFVKKLFGIKAKEDTPVIPKPVEEPNHIIPKDPKIEKLYPGIRNKVYAFIEEAKAIDAYVFSGLRTFEEQAEIYARGRTKPGKIVTNARPGYSYHNYGLAIDMAFGGPGKWTWNSTQWTELGKIGEKHGFTWGGKWIQFPDRPHFQIILKQTLSKLLQVYNTRNKLEDVWTYLDTL